MGVYVGYDNPKTLGKSETGSRVAAPIFGEFMREAYVNRKPSPFIVPDGIKFINIDLKTGNPSSKNYIQEAFKKDFQYRNQQDNFLSDDEYDTRGFY